MSDFPNTSADASRRVDALSGSADAPYGRRLSGISRRVAIFSALVLLVSQANAQSPAIPEPLTLVAAMTIGGPLDVAFIEQSISPLLLVMPLDYAAGSMIGVATGLAWGASWAQC